MLFLVCFSAIIRRYHRLGSWQRTQVYVTHDSGVWVVQVHGTRVHSGCALAPQCGRGHHMARQALSGWVPSFLIKPRRHLGSPPCPSLIQPKSYLQMPSTQDFQIRFPTLGFWDTHNLSLPEDSPLRNRAFIRTDTQERSVLPVGIDPVSPPQARAPSRPTLSFQTAQWSLWSSQGPGSLTGFCFCSLWTTGQSSANGG